MLDHLTFPKYLRKNLRIWRSDAKKRPTERAFLGSIKNSLDLIISNKPIYLYYVAPDEEYGVPECFVDFCRVYTVSTDLIEDLKDNRLAVIDSPYREEFARKFADYYARIATPHPMRGKPIS